MDWSQVKTVLIVGFALLNGLLVWQLRGDPVAGQQPVFLSEPTREQVDEILAESGFMVDHPLPVQVEALPALAAAPRSFNERPEDIWHRFFGEVPMPEGLLVGPARFYRHEHESLLMGAGRLEYANRSPDVLRRGMIHDSEEEDDAQEASVAFVRSALAVAQDFLTSHGDLPDDVERRDLAPDLDAGRLLLRYDQIIPGRLPVFDGYVELLVGTEGVLRYTWQVWDIGRALGPGRPVMPAATVLLRHGRPGGVLSGRGDDDNIQVLNIYMGYLVLPVTAAEIQDLVINGERPDFVAKPVWRLELPDGWFVDVDAATGNIVQGRE
ncbi:MAG: hypothetical protein WD535_00740 [Thermaerobacterales bacterium]